MAHRVATPPRPLNHSNALVQPAPQRLAVNVCCLCMDQWEPESRAVMRRAAEWQLEGAKLRATAMRVSDPFTHEQLLMLAEDCENEALREASARGSRLDTELARG